MIPFLLILLATLGMLAASGLAIWWGLRE